MEKLLNKRNGNENEPMLSESVHMAMQHPGEIERGNMNELGYTGAGRNNGDPFALKNSFNLIQSGVIVDENNNEEKRKEKIDSFDKKIAELKNEINEITRGRSLDGLDVAELKEVLNRYKLMEGVLGISGKKIEGTLQEQMDMAKEVMGEEFFGFQEVKKAFGIEINPEGIPEIPFSREELEKAKELNQFLVLRINMASDGKPLTLQKINEILKGKVSDGSKLLYADDGTGKIKSDSWYKDEGFSKVDKPKLAWALVSKEVIPNSTSKNYLNQTEELVGYLKNQVFKGEEMPEEYKESIKEFEKEKGEIEKLMSSDWEKAAEKLSGLKINQMTRQNPAEALYDIAIYFQNKGERILEKIYTWTARRGSDGELVVVGGFDSGGAGVSRHRPGGSSDHLGVAFSRSL